MNRSHFIAKIILWALPLLTIPLWLITFPQSSVRHNMNPALVYAGQLTAVTGFGFFAISFILATRIKKLEDWLGGLDRIYQLHHTFGRAALMLLFLHPILLALRWLPRDTEKIYSFLFPIHRRLEVNLGSYAWWGFLLLLILTLFIKVPYDKWKITHKLMGIFFGISIAHIFLFEKLVSNNLPLYTYLALLSGVAFLAFLYRTVLFNLFVKKYPYQVTAVDRLNEQVVEVKLVPEHSPLKFTPGQFCFFSFRTKGISREAHPYTLCSTPGEQAISINVKKLGNYTRQLYERLQPGGRVLLEGPYGRFDYSKGPQEQIWIAGGVGIAPFISWTRDLLHQPNKKDLQIDLYYCANTEEDAIHLSLFQDLSEQVPGFQLHLVCADTAGFLDAEQIPGLQEKSIFFCGPTPMRKALMKAFRKMNIPRRQVHYENFDFS